MKILESFKAHSHFKLDVFILSFCAFPFLVIFGTLTHELGHIALAEILGFETILHYGSMDWYSNGINGNDVESNLNIFLVTLGGPVQTMLTGLFGIFLLIKSSKKELKWLGVFLGLFWSRQVINLFMGFFYGIFLEAPFFGGDELIMSELLNLPNGFFSIFLGIIGLFICLYIISSIEIKERFSFLIAGLVSGFLTYIVWFGYIGELILP